MKKAIFNTIHIILSITIGLFFINAGYKKLTSDKLKPIEKDQLIEYVISKNSYEAPVGYNVTMNTFKKSGFLDMISIFQILAGILIVIPKSRLLGLLFLLPIIFNIFFMHVFFDNRMHENIETGILLTICILLISKYYKKITPLLTVEYDDQSESNEKEKWFGRTTENK